MPTLVRSPLLPRAARGSTNGAVFHVTDWLPTLVGLAGGSTARNKALDGLDLWPALWWGGGSGRLELFHCDVDRRGKVHPDDGKVTSMKGDAWTALRVGDLKLLQNKDDGLELYNISADPNEKHDLAKKPELAAVLGMLLDRLAYWRTQSVPAWTEDDDCHDTLGPVYVDGKATFGPTCEKALVA